MLVDIFENSSVLAGPSSISTTPVGAVIAPGGGGPTADDAYAVRASRSAFPRRTSFQEANVEQHHSEALERMGCKGRMTGHRVRGVASIVQHKAGRTSISNVNWRIRSATK